MPEISTGHPTLFWRNEMDYLKNVCESIDASVFSSDMLFDDERRKLLEYYVGRWTRAIIEHEQYERSAEEK